MPTSRWRSSNQKWCGARTASTGQTLCHGATDTALRTRDRRRPRRPGRADSILHNLTEMFGSAYQALQEFVGRDGLERLGEAAKVVNDIVITAAESITRNNSHVP